MAESNVTPTKTTLLRRSLAFLTPQPRKRSSNLLESESVKKPVPPLMSRTSKSNSNPTEAKSVEISAPPITPQISKNIFIPTEVYSAKKYVPPLSPQAFKYDANPSFAESVRKFLPSFRVNGLAMSPTLTNKSDTTNVVSTYKSSPITPQTLKSSSNLTEEAEAGIKFLPMFRPLPTKNNSNPTETESEKKSISPSTSLASASNSDATEAVSVNKSPPILMEAESIEKSAPPLTPQPVKSSSNSTVLESVRKFLPMFMTQISKSSSNSTEAESVENKSDPPLTPQSPKINSTSTETESVKKSIHNTMMQTSKSSSHPMEASSEKNLAPALPSQSPQSSLYPTEARSVKKYAPPIAPQTSINNSIQIEDETGKQFPPKLMPQIPRSKSGRKEDPPLQKSPSPTMMEVSKWNEKTLASTRQMVKMCLECKELGIGTLVALDEQEEQLYTAENGLDVIDEDMKEAHKNINKMGARSLLCACFPWGQPNWMKHETDPSEKKKNKSKELQNILNSSSQHYSSHPPNAATNENPENQAGTLISRITGDESEDLMESDLADINEAIGNLRAVAIDMWSAIEHHDETVDKVKLKIISDQLQVNAANKNVHHLLTK